MAGNGTSSTRGKLPASGTTPTQVFLLLQIRMEQGSGQPRGQALRSRKEWLGGNGNDNDNDNATGMGTNDDDNIETTH